MRCSPEPAKEELARAEAVYRRYGAVLVQERWQAILTVDIRPGDTPEAIEQNPLGLYVTDIQWTKQL